MNEKPKRKLGWRLLRWGLIGMVALVTLVALLVTEENWRGKHAWENYKREAAARGERLDIASVIPPAVPDEQNFFCAPIVVEAWEALQKQAPFDKPLSDYRTYFNIYRGDPNATPNDFKMTTWRDYFRKFNETPEGKTNGFPVPSIAKTPAEDVLFGLSRFDSALEELRLAAARPVARMPLDYDKGFDGVSQLLPWLSQTKRCGQFLSLRIRAELEASQTDKALADIKLFQRIAEIGDSQPLLISELVRIAMLAILQYTISESLQQNYWSDAQLAELQTVIAKEDFFTSFTVAMEHENIYAIDAFEKQRITRQMREKVETDGKPQLTTNSLRLMPDAYFYRNQLAVAEMRGKFIMPIVDFTNRIIAPTRMREIQDRAEKELAKGLWLYNYQTRAIYPAISAAVAKIVKVQAQLDMTRIACALERFHLAHGNYPDTLDSIAPQFLEQIPHDIINGQPLHYRRTDDGKFLLYSVGWDETDDGGMAGTLAAVKKGDWVWQYPAK